MAASTSALSMGESQTALADSPLKLHTWVEPGRSAFATARPAALQQLLFVSTYNESDPASPAPKKHGYQRPPSEDRFPQIGRYYLDDDHRYLITPIIVSVRLEDPEEIDDFVRLFNAGDINEIHRRWDKAVVSTVDGQHRKGGLYAGWQEDPAFTPNVPLMLYFALDYKAEAELFDTINSTQRKLPRALIEVTKGDITEAGQPSHTQEVRKITFALARDKDSVWLNQINMTGARDPERKVTYEGLRRSTSNMFPAELIDRIKNQNDSATQYAKKYWELVSKTCYKAWLEKETRPITDPDTGQPIVDPDTGEPENEPVPYRLKELVGVAALSKLGKDIITSALEHSNPKEKMAEFVDRLAEVDWEKRPDNPWMATEAGFAGQKDLYRMLYALVYMDERPGEAS